MAYGCSGYASNSWWHPLALGSLKNYLKHIDLQNSSKASKNPSIGFIRLKIVIIEYFFVENGYWLLWIGFILLLALGGPWNFSDMG